MSRHATGIRQFPGCGTRLRVLAMRALAMFARPPVAGSVKTRLSPALPAALSTSLYSGLLSDSIAAVAACAAERRCIYWSDVHADATPGVESRTQHGADLGERLAHAFSELLAPPADRALVVASDTPALSVRHVDAAFELLERYDAVIGPAHDGGYW